MLDLERKHPFCERRVLGCVGEAGEAKAMALAAQEELWDGASRDTSHFVRGS